jgi:pimeloyl-ACP methyl ester carboxylesterase
MPDRYPDYPHHTHIFEWLRDYADAEPGYRANAGPSWRDQVAARILLKTSSYRPGLQADRLPCPILVQIADRDSVAPVKAAQNAVWRATGRGELRTYPISHFEIYRGAPSSARSPISCSSCAGTSWSARAIASWRAPAD